MYYINICTYSFVYCFVSRNDFNIFALLAKHVYFDHAILARTQEGARRAAN